MRRPCRRSARGAAERRPDAAGARPAPGCAAARGRARAADPRAAAHSGHLDRAGDPRRPQPAGAAHDRRWGIPRCGWYARRSAPSRSTGWHPAPGRGGNSRGPRGPAARYPPDVTPGGSGRGEPGNDRAGGCAGRQSRPFHRARPLQAAPPRQRHPHRTHMAPGPPRPLTIAARPRATEAVALAGAGGGRLRARGGAAGSDVRARRGRRAAPAVGRGELVPARGAPGAMPPGSTAWARCMRGAATPWCSGPSPPAC